MEARRDWRHRLTSIFDLPGDVVLDLARVTLIGDVQMAIENHRGLVEYGPDRMVVSVPRGCLQITGADLVIGSITPEEIILQGRIHGLQFADSSAQRG